MFDHIHQRQVMPPETFIVETCCDNDTRYAGTPKKWAWANPTNTAHPIEYGGRIFLSVEALWQGCKVFTHDGEPDMQAGGVPGLWRRAKKRRPYGHWGGPGQPPITSAGEARRRIYVPAYRRQIELWLRNPHVARWVADARLQGDVYLRDWDIGKGLDNHGPMSHAWLLAYYLNNGDMPEGIR